MYCCILVQPSCRISQPVPASSIIKGTNDVPLDLVCISTGGYPRQTVNWYKYQTGQNPVKITQCTTSPVINQDLYDVTESCTLTPTQAEDGARLYCESSYTGTPRLLAKSQEVQLQLLCKLPRRMHEQILNNSMLVF